MVRTGFQGQNGCTVILSYSWLGGGVTPLESLFFWLSAGGESSPKIQVIMCS